MEGDQVSLFSTIHAVPWYQWSYVSILHHQNTLTSTSTPKHCLSSQSWGVFWGGLGAGGWEGFFCVLWCFVGELLRGKLRVWGGVFVGFAVVPSPRPARNLWTNPFVDELLKKYRSHIYIYICVWHYYWAKLSPSQMNPFHHSPSMYHLPYLFRPLVLIFNL